MKRLFYSILILLMIPGLLMAQGLSLKSINDNLTTNYSTTAVTQAWVNSRGFLTTADFAAYRLVVDSYSTSEVDTLLNAKLNADVINNYYTAVTVDMFLGAKANSADVYTTGAVDLLLLNKVDTSTLAGYYTALQVDVKLVDYATTGSVAFVDGKVDTQKERFDTLSSSGALTDVTITDNGTGGVYISPFEFEIKTSDSDTAELAYFTQATTVEIESASLTDNSMNWIYVDYNSGTPTFNATATRLSVRTTDQFIIGFLFKSGTTLKIVSHGIELANFPRREEERLYSRGIVERMSGAVIGEKATRYITMTEGVFYTGISRTVRTAQDSETDGFDGYWSYNAGTGVWTNNVATYPNQIENTLYNNTATGALATLTNNKYGVHWIYICGDGKLQVVFGQGNYSLSSAQASQPPSVLPACMTDLSVLLGRVIILKNATTFTEVDSAFNTQFSPSGVQNHNDLAGRTEATAHPATALDVDTTSFSGNLTAADDTVQKALATLDALSGLPATNAITRIYGTLDLTGSGTGEVWFTGKNGVTVDRTDNTFEVDIDSATKFGDYYTKAETNATIEAAIAAIPAVSQDFVKIGEYSPSGSEATYTISSIPNTYKILKLFINAATTEAGDNTENLYCRFNGDSAANHYATASASATATPFTFNADKISTLALLGAYNDGASANIEITINNSKATGYKTIYFMSCSMYYASSSNQIFCFNKASIWNDLDDLISSITLFTDGANFSATSKFELYGLK